MHDYFKRDRQLVSNWLRQHENPICADIMRAYDASLDPDDLSSEPERPPTHPYMVRDWDRDHIQQLYMALSRAQLVGALTHLPDDLIMGDPSVLYVLKSPLAQASNMGHAVRRQSEVHTRCTEIRQRSTMALQHLDEGFKRMEWMRLMLADESVPIRDSVNHEKFMAFKSQIEKHAKDKTEKEIQEFKMQQPFDRAYADLGTLLAEAVILDGETKNTYHSREQKCDQELVSAAVLYRQEELFPAMRSELNDARVAVVRLKTEYHSLMFAVKQKIVNEAKRAAPDTKVSESARIAGASNLKPEEIQNILSHQPADSNVVKFTFGPARGDGAGRGG